VNRLFGAVEQVIAERGVADLTVQEVAARAGLAVGTLYTRFAGKDALLRAFTADFFGRARRTAETVLDHSRWGDLPPRELVLAVVRMLVRSYRAKRGLLRALHLYVRAHPDSQLRTLAASFTAEFVRRLTELLLRHRKAIAHPEPERAVLLGFLMVDGGARETILFGDGRPAELAVPDDELIEALTQAYCRFLELA
jgi:AcrR family transcriptional regulator